MRFLRAYSIALSAIILALVTLSPLSCSLISDEDRDSLERMETGLTTLNGELRNLNNNLSNNIKEMTSEISRLSNTLENFPLQMNPEELQSWMDTYLTQVSSMNANLTKLDELLTKLEEMNQYLEGNQTAVEDLTSLLRTAMGQYPPQGSDPGDEGD